MKNKKLFLVSILFISGLYFFNTTNAAAATLYFNGAADSNWNTLTNWWTDSEFSSQALALPTTTDDVIISANITSNSGQAASVNSMVVNSPDSFTLITVSITKTVANGATFNVNSRNNGILNGDAVFNGSSFNGCCGGVINGDVIFNDTGRNDNYITGDVIFNDNSYNNHTITGNAIFNDSSSNRGSYSISGNAEFYDSSYNNRIVEGDACFAVTADNNGTVNGTVSVCSSAVPTVVTNHGAQVGPSLMGLVGSITATGGESSGTVGIQYGLDTSYGTTKIISGTFNTGPFVASSTSFTCNTTYHLRAFATNSAGTSYGSDITLITNPCSSDPEPILYGVDGSGGNSGQPKLYILNKLTGDKEEEIGNVGFHVSGMAFHPTTGVLYGSTASNGNSPKSLITISTTTGAGTLLGVIKNSGNTSLTMPDISFRSDGRLYGFSQGSTDDLHVIDISSCDGIDVSCLATKVGDSDLETYGNGLTFDNEDNLYLFGDGDAIFFQIDPDTGSVVDEIDFFTPSPAFGTYSIASAAFLEEDVIYASRLNFGSAPTDLIGINLESETIVSTGENSDMLYMDAIAIYFPPPTPDPSPEPEEEPRRNRGGSSIPRGSFPPPPVVNPISGPFATTTSYTDIAVLQNRINELLAQIKALQQAQGTSQIKVSDIITNLTMGSEGENVKALQTFLISQNLGPSSLALSTVGATGYFGILTQGALAEYQRINGITPPAGYFGPITKAHLKLKGF